jgi:hypothetical protein
MTDGPFPHRWREDRADSVFVCRVCGHVSGSPAADGSGCPKGIDALAIPERGHLVSAKEFREAAQEWWAMQRKEVSR